MDENNFESEDDYSKEFIEKTKELNDDLTRQLNARINNFGEELKVTFENRVAAFNCRDRDMKKVTNIQHEILKTNKIFRDISRPLSSNWKIIFFDLIPPATLQLTIEEKIIEIEKEKSFMQAYKALLTWKELSGADFNINDLPAVLEKHKMLDLAKTVENIIHCDNADSLFNLSNQFVEPSKISSLKKADSSNQNSMTSNIGKPLSKQDLSSVASINKNLNPLDALDDRHLLLLSKKLALDWPNLASHLSIHPDDIAEILNAEGSTYQGGFRMLHGWREAEGLDIQQKLTNLTNAFASINRIELEEILKS